MSLIFNQLSEEKIKIAKQQQKEIENLYKQWAEEIAKKEAYYKTLSLGSSELMSKYYKTLKLQLQSEVKQIGEATYNNIVGGIQATSYSVVKANLGLMNSLGFDQKYLDVSFSHIPENITQRLITGQIYEGGWNLSKAIWGDDQKTLKDLYTIVARGEAENLPIYDISKDLEKYVNPSRKLDWNPILNRTNTQTGEIVPTRIYKGQVDYNAQRLVRTLIQHSYQQSLLEVSEFNPFVTGFIWEANGSNVCEWCDERNGNFYEKGELEMDHPNGMCTFLPVLPSDEDMINELSDWYNGEENEDLDNFAKFFDFGGDTVPEIAKETGNSVAQTVLDAKVYGDTAKGIKSPAIEVTPVNQLADQGYNEYVVGNGLAETKNMANFKSLNYIENLTDEDLNAEAESLYKMMQAKNLDYAYDIDDAQADLKNIIQLTKQNVDVYLNDKYDNIISEGIDYLKTKEGMQVTRDLYKEILSNSKPETLGKGMMTLESKFMKAATESTLEANKTEALAKIINGSKSFDDWFTHSTSGTRQELLQAVFENAIPKDFKDMYFIDLLSADKESCRLFYNYLVNVVKSDQTMLIVLNLNPTATMVQHASEPIVIKKVTQKSITVKEDMLDKMFTYKGFDKDNMPTFTKWLKTLSNDDMNLILQDIGSSAKIGTDQFNKDIGKFLEKYKKILLADDSVTTTVVAKSETANDLKALFGMKYEKGNALADFIDMHLQEDMTKSGIPLDNLEKKKLKSMLTSFGYKGDLQTMYDNFYNDYLKVFEWVKYEDIQKILGYVPKELSQESKSILFNKYFDKNLYKGKNVKGIYKYDSSLDFIYSKYGVKDIFSSLTDEELEALLKDAYSIDRKKIEEEILKSYKTQIESFSINNDKQAVKEYISHLVDQKYNSYTSLFEDDYLIFQGKSYDQIAEYLTNAKFKDIDKAIKDAIPAGPIEMETSTYNTILKEYAFNGYDKNNVPSFEEWYVSLKKSDLIQIVDDTYLPSSGKTYQTLTTIEKRALFEKQYAELITKIKNMPDEDFNAVVKKVFKPFAKLGDNYGKLGIGDTANSKVREIIINKKIEEKSLKLSKEFMSSYSSLSNKEAFLLNAKYDFNPEEIRKAFLMNEKGMTEKEAIAEVNRQSSIKFDNEFLNNWSEEAYNQLRKDNAVFCQSIDESMKKFSDFEKNVWEKLTKEERDALHKYTSGSGKFNKPLRGMENWEDIKTYVGQEFFDNDTFYLYSLAGKYNDNALEGIKAIERAINKAVTNQDIWLQRGTKTNGAANFLHITKDDILDLSESELRSKLIGREITDKGFYSTGAAKGTGFDGNCLFNVYAPKGTKMMYINNHSEFKGENEFILQRNTKFRVTKVEKKGGQLYIDVEVVSQI